MHISLQMQITSELRMGVCILLLGLGQKLDWAMGFQSKLGWELDLVPPFMTPYKP
jgi:hypothetical protein